MTKKIKKLYTAGDGFCCNHTWPMWSKILADILECQWINLSTYGAGNEAIANLVLDQLSANEDYCDSLWLIQWTLPKRLDLRIDHLDNNSQLLNYISSDPVYYDNFISTSKQKKYWCSSASTLEFVNNHNDLMNIDQHNDRSRHHAMSVAYALTKHKVNWKYLLTYKAYWLPLEFINESNWILQDMSSFRKISQYAHLDINRVQPISSIHLDFLEKFILPQLEYNPERLEIIKNKILTSDVEQYNKNVG